MSADIDFDALASAIFDILPEDGAFGRIHSSHLPMLFDPAQQASLVVEPRYVNEEDRALIVLQGGGWAISDHLQRRTGLTLAASIADIDLRLAPFEDIAEAFFTLQRTTESVAPWPTMDMRAGVRIGGGRFATREELPAYLRELFAR